MTQRSTTRHLKECEGSGRLLLALEVTVKHILFLSLLAGCIPTDGTLVSSSGATVCSDDGLACIAIPADALSEEASFTVEPFGGATPSTLFGLAYAFEPADIEFAVAATVSVAWDTGSPTGVTLGTLDGAEFFPLTAFTVDLGAGHTSAETLTLGTFLNITGDDFDGDGHPAGLDCDDSDPAIHPGAQELCDGIDTNCDGILDPTGDVDGDGDLECWDCDDADPLLNLRDADQDGFDTCAGDCDDGDGAVFPGADEVCDNVDNDCDGQLDDPTDNDNDGWSICSGDCDDTDPEVRPDTLEVCDGIDNDCNGSIDDGLDGDQDGFSGCVDDCDDENPLINPAALEVCDGEDNDCDWEADEDFDLGGDGFATCNGDCDDTDASVHVLAPEVCDGIDNDCDGQGDEAFDGDFDGFPVCEDCDDNDPVVFPGAPELCDLVDNDCDGVLGPDVDGDGVPACLDCNDFAAAWTQDICSCFHTIDPALFPDGCSNSQATMDCAGQTDFDGDGYCGLGGIDLDGDGLCTGPGEWLEILVEDCDDTDGTVFPGATEVCGDWIDQDCDGAIDEDCGFCSDGVDNDLDGWIDVDDPDCATVGAESGPGGDACNNGLDDDGDGLIDSTDLGCTTGSDPSE